MFLICAIIKMQTSLGRALCKPVIKRLSFRAGITRLHGLTYEEIRGIARSHLETVLRDALIFTSQARRTTLQEKDVSASLANNGMKNSWISGFPKKKKKKDNRAACRMDGEDEDPEPRLMPAPGGVRRTRRYRPGTRALMNVRKMQKSTDALIPRAPLKELVKEISRDFLADTRLGEKALDLIQQNLESFLISLLSRALLCAIHAKRESVQPRDLQLARRMELT